MLQLINWRQCFLHLSLCLNHPRTFTNPSDLGEPKHTIEQIIPSFLENKIDSLTYCIYLYTYKNTAVHRFPQREGKQPGPFSRPGGKVSHSPVLAGCYMSQWQFCFLSRPDAFFFSFIFHVWGNTSLSWEFCLQIFPYLKCLSYLKMHFASP